MAKLEPVAGTAETKTRVIGRTCNASAKISEGNFVMFMVRPNKLASMCDLLVGYRRGDSGLVGWNRIKLFRCQHHIRRQSQHVETVE